jgi:hypothetical protein
MLNNEETKEPRLMATEGTDSTEGDKELTTKTQKHQVSGADQIKEGLFTEGNEGGERCTFARQI